MESVKDKYVIKCSKGFIEYIETYEGVREYGFTTEIEYAKKYTGEISASRALREFKKITGINAVKVKV